MTNQHSHIMDHEETLAQQVKITEAYKEIRTRIRDRLAVTGCSEIDIQDNIQDTICVLLDKDWIFHRPECEILAYALIVSRNIWLKERKRQIAEQKLQVEYPEDLQVEESDDCMIRNLEYEIFTMCIRKLREEERRIVRAIRKGMKNERIARLFGYKREAFKKMKKRCIDRICDEVVKNDLFDFLNALKQGDCDPRDCSFIVKLKDT